jgi:hypothetical protein
MARISHPNHAHAVYVDDLLRRSRDLGIEVRGLKVHCLVGTV